MPSIPHTINSHHITVQSPGTHRILVVDDEPAILFAYRRLIEKEGMCVDISTCLEEALALVKEYLYLAVIADMRLAGSDNTDGFEFLRTMHTSHPDTKMILATGGGSSEIKNTAYALGAHQYFEKPVQPAEIIAALKHFILLSDKTALQTAS